jgi:S-adenosylmethionine hydrolase
MPIITLTTDWSSDDFYTGTLKGKILCLFPTAIIVDISNQIQSFNLAQAAFILKNSYPHFPSGTIHIIGINTEAHDGQSFLAAHANGHFFIGCDNGIFGLIFRKEPKTIIKIKPKNIEPVTFPSLSVFADAAVHLAKGEKISDLGNPVKDYVKKVPLRATIEEAGITGSVIYIDSYQNAITNITKDLFERIGKDRTFEILIQSNYYKLNKIIRTYGETSVGEILALFNSLNLLEIAIKNGNAAELLNLTVGSTIRINFLNTQK